MTKPLAPTTIGERQAIAEKAREIFEAECICASELLPKARVVGIDVFERLVVSLATPATNPPVAETCEVCEHPDLCLNGRTICDLSSEFVATVPAEIANKLLDETRRYGKPAGSLADAVERLGQIKDFFTTAGHAEWLADLQTVLRSTLPIHGEMREALDILRRQLPDLDAAACPTKCETYVVCGGHARAVHDAIKTVLNALKGDGL